MLNPIPQLRCYTTCLSLLLPAELSVPWGLKSLTQACIILDPEQVCAHESTGPCYTEECLGKDLPLSPITKPHPVQPRDRRVPGGPQADLHEWPSDMGRA